MLQNSSKMFDLGVVSPIECSKLHIIAYYLIIIFILGIISNSILLLILIRYKDMRVTLNIFVATITILNLFGTLTELPFVIHSHFKCRFETLKT